MVRVEGEALAGLQLRLEATDPPLSQRFGVTDGAGEFAFDGLDEGTYELEVSGVPDAVDLAVPHGQAVLTRARPEAWIEFAGLRRRDATIRVVVLLDALGAPGVQVDLRGPESRTGTTDDTGHAEFTALLRGTYEVVLTGFDPERVAFSRTLHTVDAQGVVESPIQFEGVVLPRIPAAPTGLAATAASARAVELAWSDPADNEDRFELERRDEDSEVWTVIATPTADAVGVRDESVEPASTLIYRVRACNDDGCSEPSNDASVSTPDVPPLPPTDLSAVALGPHAIALTWTDASTNESGFEVERRLDPAGPWTAAGTTGPDVARLDDSGLASGMAYGYRVRACNPVGCSPFVGPVSQSTVVVPPLAPQGLAATATAHDRVVLAWADGSPDETGFRIERWSGGGWGEIGVVGAESNGWADTGVMGATSYDYRVFACNTAGCSEASNVASVTTPAPPPNLSIGAAYIVQRTQRLTGDVPLVSGLDGVLRVFPLANQPGVVAASVRVQFFQSGGLVQTVSIPAPMATMPTSIDESSLSASWNLSVPGALIQPGFGMRVMVDPDDLFDEGDESDNSLPAGGAPLALDVRTTPRFDVTFVPVRQSANNTVGNIDPGNAESYLTDTRRMMPFASDDWVVHAEYVTDTPVLQSDGTGWNAVLSEIGALRTAEGSSRAYFGAVPTTYGGGVAGMGYVGWPVALGWDKAGSRSSVAAHEWGHNFGRRHSPGCGAGNPDGAYPHAGGKIGVWGLDVPSATLKSPQVVYDLMSYCGPEWISDYVFERVLAFRGPAPVGGAPAAPASRGGLLVWGRIEEGRIILEPAFAVDAPPRLPEAPGAYTLEAASDEGVVFRLSFDPIPVADGDPDEGHFAFVVPLGTAERAEIRELRVTGRLLNQVERRAAVGVLSAPGRETRIVSLDGRTVDISWDATRAPMAMVRDAVTGEILSFARGGSSRLAPSGSVVEVLLSDGLGTAQVERVRWRE